MVSNCISKADFLSFNTASGTESTGSAGTGKFEQFIGLAGIILNNSSSASNADTGITGQAQTENALTNNEMLLNMLSALADKKTEMQETDNTDMLAAAEYLIAGINQIMELIQEKFSITDEQLKNVMQENDIQPGDLLSNEGLTKLMAKLSPQENILNLLTDSALSGATKDIFLLAGEIKDSLLSKYNMDNADLEKLIHQIFEETASGADDMAGVSDGSETTVNLSLKPETAAVNSLTAQKTQVQTTADSQTLNASKAEIQPNESDTLIQPDNSKDASNQSSLQNDSFMSDYSQTVLNKISDALGQTDGEIDSSDIIRQLVEKINVTVKEDLSKMEVQLYPEHLGKVSLEVISKNEAITAQIRAQSEAVKEALESNIPALKENLESQGLKVESVEVSVAEQEYGQNFNDGKGQENDSQGKKQKFISIEELDARSDMSSIEELLEEQRMQMDGNTVSYKA